MKILFIAIFLIFSLFQTKKASADVILAAKAKASILIEPTTNSILYENNKDEKLRIASMTKIMTLIITYDAIHEEKLRLDDKLITSSHAKSMEGTRVFLDAGDESLVKDLIKCVAIASANDAAVTLAEGIAGTEEVFVKLMNEKSTKLGMENTLFSDCTGLSDDNHYSTAYDMAKASSYLINNYKEVLEYTALKESYFREDSANPFWLVNTNKLAGRYEGIDGLKTGWTSKAGYCMSLTGIKNDIRLISVVLGEESPLIRNKEALELLNYGFQNYSLKTFIKKDTVLQEYKSIFYKENKIQIKTNNDITLIIKKGEENKYNVIFDKASSIEKKGTIKITYAGEEILKEELDFIEGKKRNFFSLLGEVLINSML